MTNEAFNYHLRIKNYNRIRDFIFPFSRIGKDGKTETINMDYNQGVYEFIAAINMILEDDEDHLLRKYEQKDSVSSERVYFYKINNNSLENLKVGGRETLLFYKELNEKIKYSMEKFNQYFFLTLCLGFIFIHIFVHSWIHKLFGGQKNIMKILGLVPIQKCYDIFEKIAIFKKVYLEDYIEDSILDDSIGSLLSFDEGNSSSEEEEESYRFDDDLQGKKLMDFLPIEDNDQGKKSKSEKVIHHREKIKVGDLLTPTNKGNRFFGKKEEEGSKLEMRKSSERSKASTPGGLHKTGKKIMKALFLKKKKKERLENRLNKKMLKKFQKTETETFESVRKKI